MFCHNEELWPTIYMVITRSYSNSVNALLYIQKNNFWNANDY